MGNTQEKEHYHRTQMQKDIIIQKLKERGLRITRQRLVLLDIILEDECSCCKEIYCKALKAGENVGTATVYRMINTLEEVGAIIRNNIFRVACHEECEAGRICTVVFDDGSELEMSEKKWNQIVCVGLKEFGPMGGREEVIK